MTRQSAQVALGRDPFAVAKQLVRRNRCARKFGMGGKKRRDLLLAFLALQGADGKDQDAAGLDQAGGAFQNLVGPGSRNGHIGGTLDPGQVGMAAGS